MGQLDVFLLQTPKPIVSFLIKSDIGHRNMICYHYTHGFSHSVGITRLIYDTVPKTCNAEALVSFLWVYQEQNERYCPKTPLIDYVET